MNQRMGRFEAPLIYGGLPFGCAPFLRQGKQGKKPRPSTGKKMPAGLPAANHRHARNSNEDAGLPFVPQGTKDPALC